MSINAVAPLAGAWIEITDIHKGTVGCSVAPLAGAWIEMVFTGMYSQPFWSLPSRERGLKFPKIQYCLLPYASLPSRERGLKCNNQDLTAAK